MSTQQTPDYGEPWKMLSREVGDFTTHPTPHDVNNKQVCDPYRNGLVEDCQKRAERIVQCVNACAGMADPSKEIEELKECRTRYIEVCANLQECVQKHDIGLGGEKLDQLVCAEIAAMREAIKEAYDALKLWPKAGIGMSTDFTKQAEAFRAGQAAIAKLQPFITQPA